MNQITELYKVLSDETRIRIINLLYRQDLCVCELVELLSLSQPKISKHIARLRQINLVTTERNEQYIYYRFNHQISQYENVVKNMIAEVNSSGQYNDDITKLKEIESFVCTR